MPTARCVPGKWPASGPLPPDVVGYDCRYSQIRLHLAAIPPDVVVPDYYPLTLGECGRLWSSIGGGDVISSACVIGIERRRL